MFRSRVSVLEGHNKNAKTDQLYEPLRKAFHLDTTSLKHQLEQVSHVSNVSHLVKTHTFEESLRLAEQTYIPQDVRLRPTHNAWKIGKDHIYYIINVEQKIHTPISEEEMERILKNQHSEEIIVYTMEDEEKYQNNERIEQLWSKITQQNQINSESSKAFTYPPTQINSVAYAQQKYQDNPDKRNNTFNMNQKYNLVSADMSPFPYQSITNAKNPNYSIQYQNSSYLYKNEGSTYNQTNQINTQRESQSKANYTTPITKQNSNHKYQIDESTMIEGNTYNTKRIEEPQMNPEQQRSQYVAKQIKPIQRKNSGILITQKPKYNLFSAIDEPVNNILSGKACTCPANTIVAEQMNEISWYNNIRRQ